MGEIDLNSLVPKPIRIVEGVRKKKDSPTEDVIGTFGNILKESLKKVNEVKIQSNILTQRLAAGDVDNLHEVMIAAQRSELVSQLTLEIRNKIIRAYQEMMMMR
jgi:flagellar hook-basal body complex protein FliE